MAQVQPHFCPRCGTAIATQRQSCPHCGLKLPPPSLSPLSSPASHASIASVDSPTTPIPDIATTPLLPVPVAKKQSMSRAMLVTGLLLLLVILGSAVYVATPMFGLHLGTAQPPITTPLHTSVTYAGITMTIDNVQQASSFTGDSATNASEVVRVQLTVANKTAVAVNLLYQNIVRLVLPGAKTVAPTYIHASIGLPAGATQTATLDFPLAKPLPARQLTLRLGAINEEQMDIPLIAHPDLSRYAPKTRTINQQLQYFGLNWTIVQVATQLSIDGQQAPQGMHYAIITFRVENPLSQVAIPGSPYGYIALKIGNTPLAPVYSTLPVSFDAGKTGDGTVAFLVSQQATAVTLLLGTQQQSGFESAVTNFSLV